MSDAVYTLGAWRVKDGPWSLDHIQEMLGHPDARSEIGKLMDLCEEGRPGTFRVAATA